MPKAEFPREVEKELTSKDSEPSELICFKVYKSQVPVIERAIETAALILESDKSRGYWLEMICTDLLLGHTWTAATRRCYCSPSFVTANSFPAHDVTPLEFRSAEEPHKEDRRYSIAT